MTPVMTNTNGLSATECLVSYFEHKYMNSNLLLIQFVSINCGVIMKPEIKYQSLKKFIRLYPYTV